MRIAYAEIVQTLNALLTGEGMVAERAARCAGLFADASRDGVPSHGLNRFSLFMEYLRAGTIVANAELKCVARFGGLERWDGAMGPGPWNASQCMGRAVELAREHGLGAVALRRTNHWMRAGNYGWQAADAGCVGICWTNTIALMPAWGGTSRGRRVGNNPLVLAMPRPDGQHVVLDMAMAQYSMGKLTLFKEAGVDAPLPAGFDAQGNETRKPEEILAGGSSMPIGYWKGAGLAMMLNILAAALAGGRATHQITGEENERGVSQFFLAVNPGDLGPASEMEQTVAAIIADTAAAGASYPGARTLAARAESLAQGVLVDDAVWRKIGALQKMQ